VAHHAAPRPAGGAAWRWVPLPSVVRRPEVASGFERGAAGGDGHNAHAVLIGVGGDQGGACWWRPRTDGRRLVVVGPSRSGRTNALCVVAQSLCAQGRFVVIVRSAADVPRMPWPSESVVLGQGDTDELVRLRRLHPDLALCVDDTDRLDDAALAPVLREITDLVDRDDGLVVVSTSSTALATKFQGIHVEVARHGCAIVLNPSTTDRGLFTTTLPDGIPRLRGRAVFVTHEGATEVQVLMAEPSVGKVASGEHLGLGVAGHPGCTDDHDRHHDHDPPDGHLVALHEAQPDREQDRVPDDGRGPRPGGDTQPAPGQGGQTGGRDEDQHRRHQHPGAVASLPSHELDDVEHREADQRQRLQPGEDCGDATAAA